MSFLSNPNLDLTDSRIETDRLVLLPFSVDGRVDISELAEEFCKANKDYFVSPFLPTHEEEIEFIANVVEEMRRGEAFQNFILEKWTSQLLGCGGLRTLQNGELNIGIWIRTDQHGKWYATEVYEALIEWARENTDFWYLIHYLDPRNIASRKLAIKFRWIKQDDLDERGCEVYNIPL